MMKRQRQDGAFEYHWRDNGDHDALDSIGQALAAYAAQGFALVDGDTRRRYYMTKKKPRIKFV